MAKPKFHLSYIPLIAAAIVGCLIFIALGTWQLYRLHWKEGIIERIHQSALFAPLSWEEVNENNYADYLFHTINVEGIWGKGLSYYVAGRIHNKRPGYHMFSIITLPNGTYLLVNLGWVDHKPFNVKGNFPAKFVGRIRKGDRPSFFMPDHKPQEQEWMSVDIDKMGQALGAPLMPFYVDYMRADTGHAPHPVPYKLDIINNHKGYAITWFTLGIVWVVMFIQLIRRTKKEAAHFS